jgi:tetratricopeptide (TPR) repeat protein
MEEKLITRKAAKRREEIEPPRGLSSARRWRDPVLYVPGFFRCYFLSASIRRRLRRLDFEVHSVRMPNFAAGDLARAARFLQERMEELRVLLGARRLSVIGQGLGGLAARCAVERLGAEECLGKLIMLGTPNHGSYTMYLFSVFRGARQMLPGNLFLAALNRSYESILSSGKILPYYSLYTPYDLVVVPWTSCRLEGAENLRVGWFCSHMGLVRSRKVAALVASLLEGEERRDGNVEEDEALLEELNSALEKNPEDEGCLYRRGMLYLQYGYYGLAIEDLNRLVKLKPDFAEAYFLRGKALRRKITYDENPLYNRAIRDFDQVIKLKPGWAEAYYHRGVCYALLNAWTEALDNWDRALILDRDYYPAYMARGIARKRKGDLAGAADDFREVLRIRPDEPDALRFLSRLEYEDR